ncbi:PREDICTED: uncharacterized protein LOC106892877 isoform X2 [Calidris pugnax]|uniref:uncharacterized protein LOC106892877 isoform X2 n=1 Tax=Calidris pugnax TaxID=198806 RepID=UPI00071D5065|nr:PREDICTED: uncharacterized protein LOC106892877 isoform X2 [Calidris pugnax]
MGWFCQNRYPPPSAPFCRGKDGSCSFSYGTEGRVRCFPGDLLASLEETGKRHGGPHHACLWDEVVNAEVWHPEVGSRGTSMGRHGRSFRGMHLDRQASIMVPVELCPTGFKKQKGRTNPPLTSTWCKHPPFLPSMAERTKLSNKEVMENTGGQVLHSSAFLSHQCPAEFDPQTPQIGLRSSQSCPCATGSCKLDWELPASSAAAATGSETTWSCPL